ncbi:MAG: DUF456 domain-containing protein [Actinomycetota bacterium]
MPPFDEFLVGVVILIGVVGAAIQIYPGSLIVAAAVFFWGAMTGGVVGWTVAVVAVVAIAIAGVVKYAVAGGHLKRAGVPGRTMLVGGLMGVIGMFVIPVIGLPIGFILGVYLAEYARLRTPARAWAASKSALQATGLTILIELMGVAVAVGAWVVGLGLT